MVLWCLIFPSFSGLESFCSNHLSASAPQAATLLSIFPNGRNLVEKLAEIRGWNNQEISDFDHQFLGFKQEHWGFNQQNLGFAYRKWGFR